MSLGDMAFQRELDTLARLDAAVSFITTHYVVTERSDYPPIPVVLKNRIALALVEQHGWLDMASALAFLERTFQWA